MDLNPMSMAGLMVMSGKPVGDALIQSAQAVQQQQYQQQQQAIQRQALQIRQAELDARLKKQQQEADFWAQMSGQPQSSTPSQGMNPNVLMRAGLQFGRPEYIQAAQYMQNNQQKQSERSAKEQESKKQSQLKIKHAKGKAATVSKKVDEALNIVNQKMQYTPAFVRGVTSGIPGTDAYALERATDTLKANLGFKEIQAMRDASPTGGALGQVSDRELTLLNSALTSLDQGLSDEQLIENLNAVKTHFNNWAATVEASELGGELSEQFKQEDPLGIRYADD